MLPFYVDFFYERLVFGCISKPNIQNFLQTFQVADVVPNIPNKSNVFFLFMIEPL